MDFLAYLLQNTKNMKGAFEIIEGFLKKSHSAKKQKGDHLGFFNIPSVVKHQKKLKAYRLVKKYIFLRCNVQQTLQNFVQEAESVRVNMADLAGL